MDLTWEKVSPFLSPRALAQQTRIAAWLPVLELRFNERYGDLITQEREPAFLDIAADALERRIDRGARAGIRRQSVNGASVDYDPRMPLTGWLLPAELADLDRICGIGGGIRSVRASAPDAIRFGNLASAFEVD